MDREWWSMNMVLLEEYHHYNKNVHHNVINYNEVHEEGKEMASTF